MDISLNNIIINIKPKLKSKNINNKIYKNNVIICDIIYKIIFDTEECKNDNLQCSNMQTVLPKEHLGDTNSITDNEKDFKSKTNFL